MRRSRPGSWTVVALACLAAAGCSRRPKYNLLVVTFDTTRADFIGAYGKKSARTPNLDRLAAEGTLFENCMTAVPITLPSHSTMFTGSYPLLHGVRDNGRFTLPPERTTLAEVLKAKGYATGAAIGGFPLTRNWGLAQGFDFYDDHITVAQEDQRGLREQQRMFFDERPAPRVNDAILPWLRQNAGHRFFAWIHYWDPHQPHAPPPPFSELYSHDLYQGEIAYADQALGAVLDELRRQGVYDRTIVVMLADHGEGRGEHDEDTHSMLAYGATLHVPMIMRVPGQAGGRRVRERVGTVDLMPTLLDLLGVPPPGEVQGRSLVPVMRNPDPAPRDRQAYYAETLSPRLSYGWGEQRVLFDGAHKYVHGPRRELYDVQQDPRELQNLAPGVEADRLEKGLQSFVTSHASAVSRGALAEVDAATRDRLAALGYISSAGAGPMQVDETLRRDGLPPQERVSTVNLWSHCKAALQRRDYLAAREDGLRLLAAEPDNAFFRALMVASHLGLGQLEAAAAVAETGPVTSQNDDLYVEVARALYAKGAQARGRALARRVVSLHPTADAHFLLAAIYGTQNALADQERELRAALARDERHRAARQTLAILLANSDRGAEAEKEFLKLVEVAPIDASARLNYATYLLKAGRSDEARGHLQRALDVAPDYWQTYLALLALQVDQGEREQAAATMALLSARCRDERILSEARRLMEGA